MCYFYYDMELARNVRQYYLDHFDELPLDKQFHFAGRLSSWNNDPDCNDLMLRLKPHFLQPDQPVVEDLRTLIFHSSKPHTNSAEIRAPYFEKYPLLQGYMLALFRVRHLLYVYGYDARQQLLEVVSEKELHDLSRALVQDDHALRILSTFAINYLYLVELILYDSGAVDIDIAKIYDLGSGYDTENKHELALMIYLYTHCIIAETNYYERPVRTEKLDVFRKMLERLEKLINKNYDDLSLDNKLEFLVCSRICGYETSISSRIYSECEKSVSTEGTFLVDTLNSSANNKRTSLASSEHRNVLFIMSTMPYSKN
jgi:hypothetical protein